jgi:N-acetylneuraminate lyase
VVKKTKGLVAAPFTPLQVNGQLNLDVVDHYAKSLCQNGVVGAFICGTTGEGMSLTTSERCRLTERWVKTAPAGLRIIVHVGHNSLVDACDLATHAQKTGADSIACMPPTFFKPLGLEGLVTWCQQVAAAAPDLPFYYYHIPSMAGFNVPVSKFLQAAGPRIPNLVGAKFTYEDLDDFEECLQLEGGRYDMLFGRDELLLSALALGARGAVGSTYNFAAPLYHSIITAFNQGDQQRAQQLQALAVQMIDLLVGCGSQPIATFKKWMAEVGVDCGPPRLPLELPAAEDFSRTISQLYALGQSQPMVWGLRNGEHQKPIAGLI